MKMLRNIRNILSAFFKELFCFDFKTGALEFLEFIFYKTGRLAQRLDFMKHERVKKVLRRRFPELIADLNKEFDHDYEEHKNQTIGETKNVFIMWYQGADNLPRIVRECVASVKRAYAGYKIIFITSDNIRKITGLPDYVFDLTDRGIITLTHLSDLVRMSVLYAYGGIWIDSTCFCTRKIPLENYGFFSIKHDRCLGKYAPKWHWTSFFLASSKNSPVIRWYRDFFLGYWKTQKVMPCYYFIDCVMSIAYEDNKTIRKIIDRIPMCCEGIYDIEKIVNAGYDKRRLDLITDNNYVLKLSWKKKYNLDRKDTFIYHLLTQKY